MLEAVVTLLISIIPGFFLSLLIFRRLDVVERLVSAYVLSFVWVALCLFVLDNLGSLWYLYPATMITKTKGVVILALPVLLSLPWLVKRGLRGLKAELLVPPSTATIAVLILGALLATSVALENFSAPQPPAEDPFFHIKMANHYASYGHSHRVESIWEGVAKEKAMLVRKAQRAILPADYTYAPGMHYFLGLAILLSSGDPFLIGKLFPSITAFFLVLSFYLVARYVIRDEAFAFVSALAFTSAKYVVLRTEYLVPESVGMVMMFAAWYGVFRFLREGAKRYLMLYFFMMLGIVITHHNVALITTLLVLSTGAGELLLLGRRGLAKFGLIALPPALGLVIAGWWVYSMGMTLEPFLRFSPQANQLTFGFFLAQAGTTTFIATALGVASLIYLMYRGRSRRYLPVLIAFFVILFYTQFPRFKLPIALYGSRYLYYLVPAAALVCMVGLRELVRYAETGRKSKLRPLAVFVLFFMFSAQAAQAMFLERPEWYRVLSPEEFEAGIWLGEQLGEYDRVGVRNWWAAQGLIVLHPHQPVYLETQYPPAQRYIDTLLKNQPSYIMVNRTSEIYPLIRRMSGTVLLYRKGDVEVYRLAPPENPVVTVDDIRVKPLIADSTTPVRVTFTVRNLHSTPLQGVVQVQIIRVEREGWSIAYEEYRNVSLQGYTSRHVSVEWEGEKTRARYRLGINVLSSDLKERYYSVWFPDTALVVK